MAETIKKDLKYFMRSTEPEVITAPGPESFKDEEGNVIQFEIKVLTQEEINKINEAYRKRSMATDKKGNPLIAMGEVVWKTEKDSAKASRHLLVEALQYPNLKDPELMKYYGCVDVTDMPLKVFPKADEYQHVSRIVMQALGLASAINDDEELEAAKKLISTPGGDGYWASVLWQRHNLRMEDFHAMPRRLQLLYIASELEEDENPVRHDTIRERRR